MVHLTGGIIHKCIFRTPHFTTMMLRLTTMMLRPSMPRTAIRPWSRASCCGTRATSHFNRTMRSVPWFRDERGIIRPEGMRLIPRLAHQYSKIYGRRLLLGESLTFLISSASASPSQLRSVMIKLNGFAVDL